MKTAMKRQAVDQAISEINNAQTIEAVQRIEDQAYGAARGSNGRMELLWNAATTRMATLKQGGAK